MTSYTIKSTAVTANDMSLTSEHILKCAIFRGGKCKTTDTFSMAALGGQSAVVIGAFNTVNGNYLRYIRAADKITITQEGGTALSITNKASQRIAILYTYRKV